MRILHVAPFYEPAWAYGGMAGAASGLARAQVLRGHDVVVLTTQMSGEHALNDVLGGVRVRRFLASARLTRLLFPWAPGLSRIIDELLAGVDVAHVHGHRSGLAAAAARALTAKGIPWVLQPHGTYPDHGQRVLAKRVFDSVAGRRIVAAASRLIAVSEAETRDLPRAATIVANGVAIAAPARPPRGPRARLLFVGSDRPQKRAAALPAVLGALPDAELALVGRFAPGFAASFGAAAARVSVRGVLGREALAAAYAAADLLLHPAVREGFGLVPFEAALCGTAAVVAGGHGCGEWFARAGGCVVPPDDGPALCAAVVARVREPGRGESEARAVAAFARAELTWERAAEAVERVYAAAIAAPRAGVA